MANGSKLAKGFEKIVKASSKGLGEVQIAIDKVLWGNPKIKNGRSTTSATDTNKPPSTTRPQTTITPPSVQGAGTNTATKGLRYDAVSTETKKPGIGERLVTTGLFNALDALNSVNLCNVVTYAYDNVNIKRKPRPDRSTWSTAQVAFYSFQDGAGLVVTAIDKYTAYPNTFIGSYFGTGPNPAPPQQAVSQSNAPKQGGIKVSAYNMYFLLKSIGEVFSLSGTGTGSLFNAEDIQLIRQVPGLGSNLNFINDFLGEVNRYTDYTQITTPELIALQQKVNKLRAVCVTVQNLDLRNTANLVGNFVGVDIRSEIQKLNEFVDVTRIVPTLKEINNSLRSFILMAQKVEKVIQIGQFIIKLAILLLKVFKFILYFFRILPIPLVYVTAGQQITVQDRVNAAKAETDGITRILKSVNSLLGVALGFVRYLTVNTNELLRRLDILLANLKACDAFKDSDVLDQLQQTRQNLSDLLDRLAIYVIDYDSKTDPEQATFGKYQIRIIDEQVVDPSIVNLRRRGVALDERGNIVAQSDLTFATDPQVIIGEVKQRLVALGLVGTITVDPELAGILSQSYDYLSNNDILEEDLTIDPANLDLPDNLNENEGLGLNAFVNNLKGGRRLRKRARQQLARQRAQLLSELAKEKQAARDSISNSVAQARAQGKTVYKYSVRVTVKQGLPVMPFTVEATSLEEATAYAKKIADPRNQNPDWTYTLARI